MIIFTSANIPDMKDIRDTQYLRSYDLLKSLCKEDIHIIETFSDENNVLKDKDNYNLITNNIYSYNKGLMELMNIKNFLLKNECEYFYKITGRYDLLDDYFFKNTNDNEYDGYFKIDSDIYSGMGYHTFLYKLKTDIFFKLCDFVFENSSLAPIEHYFKFFLKDYNIKHIDTLNIKTYQQINIDQQFNNIC